MLKHFIYDIQEGIHPQYILIIYDYFKHNFFNVFKLNIDAFEKYRNSSIYSTQHHLSLFDSIKKLKELGSKKYQQNQLKSNIHTFNFLK